MRCWSGSSASRWRSSDGTVRGTGLHRGEVAVADRRGHPRRSLAVDVTIDQREERADDAAGAACRRERSILAHREPVRPSVRDEHHFRRSPKRVSQSTSSRVERKFWRTCSRPWAPSRRRPDRIGQEVDGALGALLDGVDEVAVVALADLQLDAPARPPTTGRPFQSPSLTVSPKPSRRDFCSTTSAARWNTLICTDPTWWRLDSR